MRNFLYKHKELMYMCIYMVIYLIAFGLLEDRQVPHRVFQVSVDQRIPFVKYFVIPYFLWFLYVPAAVLFFDLRGEGGELRKLNSFLIIGMTIFLLISAVYPNGIMIRPKYLPGNDICTRLIRTLYLIDTSTNVLPSIHVYNTLGVMIALWKSKTMAGHRLIMTASQLMGVSIILSTMFIKQHSIIDVIAAIILTMLVYPFTMGPGGAFALGKQEDSCASVSRQDH